MPAEPPREVLIYFVQAVTGGPIKIGIAQDPPRRLWRIQSGNPSRLRITHTMPGSLEVERTLHKRFKAHRLEGEWFVATPALARLAGAIPADMTIASQAEEEAYQRGHDDAEKELRREVAEARMVAEDRARELAMYTTYADLEICINCERALGLDGEAAAA